MKQHYHFIGIGGIGMSALARILLDKEEKVTGSDLLLSATVEELKKKGAHIHIGQSKTQVESGAKVVYSSDIKQDNPEFARAKELQCTLLHRSELLRDLACGYKSLCVAGTHGKTTTTSLLLTVLMHAGKDPSFAVGGIVPNFSNGKSGSGDYFVLEADESDGTFVNYSPFGAIVTNVEPEHMVHYKTEERLHSAFKAFIEKVQKQELLFTCYDDPVLRALNKGISYGFGSGAALKIENFKASGWNILFDVHFEGKAYLQVQVPLTGMHNALNAAAVFGLCIKLGLDETAIRDGFKSFKGVKRRLENKGEVRHVTLLDDYGHHPTEIKATLKALREAVGERKVVALVQPHRYSRVADHIEEFATAFDFADQVYVTDIYSAREQPLPGIDSHLIVRKIKAASTVPVSYLEKGQCVPYLADHLRPHDVLVTLGAGDITAIHGDLLAAFEKKPPRKYALGLVFGGRSCEHEISLRSAKFVESSLSKELYDIHYFGIDKEGKWILGEEAKEGLQTKLFLEGGQELLSKEVVEAIGKCDLFFPVLHGPFGEDGTIQGFFEMLGKPYAGPDFRSAAITMDKVLTKKLLAAGNVPTPPYVSFSYWQWRKEAEEITQAIEQLKYPFFVKPARVGSSVGVSKVNDKKQLVESIERAFRFDSFVLVEEGQINARELEFAVLGNALHKRIAVPHPAEKCAGGEFVDYEKKYSANPVKTEVNPHLEEKTLELGKKLAKKAYEALQITGMSRVDCLLNQNGTFQFFEVNSIPGLTKLSLFPKIWDREGVCGEALMNQLVIEALARTGEQNRHLNTL